MSKWVESAFTLSAEGLCSSSAPSCFCIPCQSKLPQSMTLTLKTDKKTHWTRQQYFFTACQPVKRASVCCRASGCRAEITLIPVVCTKLSLRTHTFFWSRGTEEKKRIKSSNFYSTILCFYTKACIKIRWFSFNSVTLNLAYSVSKDKSSTSTSTAVVFPQWKFV